MTTGGGILRPVAFRHNHESARHLCVIGTGARPPLSSPYIVCALNCNLASSDHARPIARARRRAQRAEVVARPPATRNYGETEVVARPTAAPLRLVTRSERTN